VSCGAHSQLSTAQPSHSSPTGCACAAARMRGVMSACARAQSQPIATPQVRPLAAGEMAARRVIIASLAARSSQSPRASPDPGAAPGPAAAPAAEPRAGDGGGAAPPAGGPGAAAAAAAAPAAAPGGAGPGGGGAPAAAAEGGGEGVGQGAGQGAGQGLGEGADQGADGWASDSSGEATDDDAFAARHQPEETAEYIRNRVHKGAPHLPKAADSRGDAWAVACPWHSINSDGRG